MNVLELTFRSAALHGIPQRNTRCQKCENVHEVKREWTLQGKLGKYF